MKHQTNRRIRKRIAYHKRRETGWRVPVMTREYYRDLKHTAYLVHLIFGKAPELVTEAEFFANEPQEQLSA